MSEDRKSFFDKFFFADGINKFTGIFLVDLLIQGIGYLASVLLLLWGFSSLIVSPFILTFGVMLLIVGDVETSDIVQSVIMVIPFLVILIGWTIQKSKEYKENNG